MATDLTGLQVRNTYNSLLKIGDNTSLTGIAKRISDGLGNDSPLFISTSQISIGVAPATGYDLTVNSGIRAGSIDVLGAATAQSLQFTGGSGTQATMSWNTDEETVDLIQNGATLQLGQEIHVHVKNQSGATINDGTPVYVTGTLGASGRLTVAPMIADGSIEAKYFLGVTTEDIPNGEDGKVTTFGKIRGLDTTAYTEGQTLYVSSTTAGFWQTTPPVAPALDLEVAIVINVSANNGTLFVRSQNGYYLGMLHDVYLNSVADNQLLVYNATNSRWENQGIASIGAINLDTVTDNGNTTTNSISVGDINAGNVTLTGYLRGAANFVIDPAAHGDDTGTVQILGNLRVDGTTTTINSTTVTIADKNIVLAEGSALPGDANGAGITIDGAAASMTYNSTTDRFVFNKDIETNLVGNVTGNLTGNVTGASSLNVLKAGDTMTGDLDFNDNVKAKFGTGDDLTVYHNATNSLIDNATGSILIRNLADDQDIVLVSDDGSGSITDYLRVDGSEGSVKLFHYGSEKLVTTATGVSVTGAFSGNLNTSSISGSTIDINASTAINLQYNGSTQLRVDTFGVAYLGTVTFANDGISLTDEDSTTDSFFHANVDYDAGLYTVTSNARYGADYIQVDGLDSRSNTRFTISPKDIGDPDPFARLYIGGNNSNTAPNTLVDWHTIYMNALSVRINNNEVATQSWVSTNYTLDLQDVTDNGAITTNGITVANMLISATAPLLDFVDTNSFTDANDRFRIRAAGDVGQIQWYDDSASTTTTLATFYPDGDLGVLGTITSNGEIVFTVAGGTVNGTITAAGGINMNNTNLTGVNNIVINDAGAGEGIEWAGGNLWKIYESPDNLTNAAGNLQFVTNATRRMTLDTSGNLEVTGTISGDGSGLTKVFNAKAELAGSVNLNDYRTTGYMSQNGNSDASSGTNYPTPYAGILEVINDDTGNGLHTVQRYSRYDSNDVYTRYYYNSGWQSWTRFLTTSDEGSGNGLDADTVDGYHASSFFIDGDTVVNMANNDGFVYDDTNNIMKVKYDGTEYDILTAANYTSFTDSKYLRSDTDDTTSGYLRVTGTSTSTSGVILGTYTGGTSLAAAEVVLGSGGKTGWGVGDEFGGIRWYNTDGSGIGARDAAKIIAICETGNGTSTTTFSGALAFYTSEYNATATESMRIDDSGNVGIGTTSPSSNISSNSTVLEISNGNVASLALNQSAVGKYEIAATGLGLDIRRNGSNYVTVNTNGNVGIGTTSPADKLDVNGNLSIYGNKIYNGAASNSAGLDFGGSYANLSGYYGIRFYSSTAGIGSMSERMRITNAGNVGIGTTSPDDKLDVNGRIRARQGFAGTDGSAKKYFYHIPNTGNSGTIWKKIGTYNPSGQSSRIMITMVGTVGYGGGITQAGKTTIVAQVNNNNLLEGSWWQEQMAAGYGRVRFDSTSQTNHHIYMETSSYAEFAVEVITSDGTFTPASTTVSDPSYTRQINRDWNVNRALFALTDYNIYIPNNLGIGNTSPNAPLDVQSGFRAGRGWHIANRAGIRLDSNGTSYPSDILFGHTAAGNQTSWTGVYWSISSRAAEDGNKFSIWRGSGNPTGGSEYRLMTFDPNLRVGIANNSPSYTLDVGGTIRASSDIIAFSDARVKENVKTIDNALDKVTKLRGVSYNKIGETEEKIGVIAQEIEKVLPQVVQEDAEGMKSVAYGNIVGVLIEAIKELKDEVNELKSQINGCTK